LYKVLNNMDDCEIPINNIDSDLSESDDEQGETKANKKSVSLLII
jgi:hypothetical protein